MKFTQVAPELDMDVDGEHCSLLEADTVDNLLEEVIAVKNRVIGNKRQKMNLINQGIVNKLINILNDKHQPEEVKIEAVIVLGSLAKGHDNQVEAIIASGAIETLVTSLRHENIRYVELCLCCLRSLSQSDVCSRQFIYSDPYIVPHLLSLASLSVTAQTCVATILADCCQRTEHQNYLHSKNAVELMLPGLCSNLVKVEMAVLKLYVHLCYQNRIVSSQMLTASYDSQSLYDIIKRHLNRCKPLASRMLAAKCFTYMHRAGALPAEDPTLLLKVLPTLVSCCKPGHMARDRIDGAEIIAYLTEVDVQLQHQASITDHCIPALASFFKECKSPGLDVKAATERDELHQACLKAFASLAANAEDIRKKVIETDNIMGQISAALSSQSEGLQLAAARCMHSLSRSVQQLRTSFQDHSVWKPLMTILNHGKNEELMSVASSTLCNLLLEFSPSKEPMLELGAIDLLVALTYSPKPPLRLNAIWALMNMAFQADQRVKAEVLTKLGTDQLFSLLRDQCSDIVMKTLGLIRNLLKDKQHIDTIMHHSGDQVIQAVVMILESDHCSEIKEQTLCILRNVADGNSSKQFIMDNDDILKKILDYMQHMNVKLQLAASYCVSNLTGLDEPGSSERHRKLKSMGVNRILQQLLNSNDQTLRDLARMTVEQLS